MAHDLSGTPAATEWRAEWIWAGSCPAGAACYVYVRKELVIERAAAVFACVTASSEYRLYVNGRYVGRGPGPSEPGRRQYDRYDLTRIIRPGKNVVGAICRSELAPGGFLMQIEINRDGDVATVGTDSTWKVTPARDYLTSENAEQRPPGTCGEVYDTRWKPVGWNVVGFDDSGWENAFVIGEAGADPETRLVPRGIPLLREWEVPPEAVASAVGVGNSRALLRKGGGAALVKPGREPALELDFGREIVGYPILKIRDSGPAVIDVRYFKDPDAHAGDASGESRVACVDRLIVHGGRREWQPFGRRVFRRLRLEFGGLDQPLHIESVTVNRIGYPVEQVSTFECSDDRLNREWTEAVHALSLCMQDGFEDDPSSGPGSRVEVARVQALANYYCFFDTLLPAEALRRFARADNPAPAWMLMLHEYYLYTGDRSLVEELYPRARRGAEYMLQGLVSDGEGGAAAFLPTDGDSEELALRYHALRAAAKLASAVGEIDDAVAWHDRAEEISRRLGSRPLSAEPRRPERIVPAYALPATVLGVRPSMPESAVVVIQPRVGELEWARGHIAFRRGFADVEWRFQAGLLTVEINAPEGFVLGLPIDRFREPAVDEIDLSPETPERRARRTYGWGTLIWRDGEEHDPYVDWLRTQEAEPPEGYRPRQRCSLETGYLWIRESPSAHVRYEVRESG